MKRLLPALALLGLPLLSLGQAPVPAQISYQGRVTDAAGVLIGASSPVNRTVVFRIWNHPTAGTRLYSESQVVTIANGEFSVLIGSGTPVTGETNTGTTLADAFNATTGVFTATGPRYLGITIDDPAVATDPEISPRQQFVMTAYAARAKVAEGLSGAITGAQIANASITSTQIAANTIGAGQIAASFLSDFAGGYPTFATGFRANLGFNVNNGGVLGNTATFQTAKHPANNNNEDANILVLKDFGGTTKFTATKDGDLVLARNLSVGGNLSVTGSFSWGGTISGAQITDGTVTTAKMADNAITTAKIADGQITGIKLGANSVTQGAIASNNITTSHLQDSSVTAAKIADGVITSAKLAPGVGATSAFTSTVTITNNTNLTPAVTDYNEQLLCRWSADPTKLLALGYYVPSTGGNGYGVIAGHFRDQAWTGLKLCPKGGLVEVGTGGLIVGGGTPTAAWNAFSVIKSAASGQLTVLELQNEAGTSVTLFNRSGQAYKGDNTIYWSTISDRRLKHNIQPISGALDQLLRLRSVTFEYNDPVKHGAGTYRGFIAQEVEAVFPDWVSDRGDGYKALTPKGLESLTVQAIRELRAEKDEQLQQRDLTIAALEKNVAAMKSEAAETKARLAKLERTLAALSAVASN